MGLPTYMYTGFIGQTAIKAAASVMLKCVTLLWLQGGIAQLNTNFTKELAEAQSELEQTRLKVERELKGQNGIVCPTSRVHQNYDLGKIA